MTDLNQPSAHDDVHYSGRTGWLRAAVLGANDGLLSVASLVVGVAAAAGGAGAVLVAGLAGLVAGAMSMAAGEYVSVSSQADGERADLARERAELEAHPEVEQAELAAILRTRGLSEETAARAAREMTAHDALAAHAREEIGLSETLAANPAQAALASALAFLSGGAPPLAVAALAPAGWTAWAVFGATVPLLLALGAIGARLGGAPVGRAALRVAVWGVAAMAATHIVGLLVGARL